MDARSFGRIHLMFHFDGNQVWELREPSGNCHHRFSQLFKYIQDSQDDTEKYNGCIDKLRLLLYENKVTEKLVPFESVTPSFVNDVISLFILPEVPSLQALTDLLDNDIPQEFVQSSNNHDAYWLNALYNVFDDIDAALKIWGSQPLSTIQALVFERRQSMMLHLAKDKITPEAISDREVQDAMKQKIDDGTAANWVLRQVLQSASQESISNAKELLNDIKLD